MDLKKITNSVLIFIVKRLLEIVGFLISCAGLLLFIALISYSPGDPNFIFPENTKIDNILSFQGSYTSDLFLQ
jgi:S-DNA-T family DNA segregation ATPase FtsK/SpoIIIE